MIDVVTAVKRAKQIPPSYSALPQWQGGTVLVSFTNLLDLTV